MAEESGTRVGAAESDFSLDRGAGDPPNELLRWPPLMAFWNSGLPPTPPPPGEKGENWEALPLPFTLRLPGEPRSGPGLLPAPLPRRGEVEKLLALPTEPEKDGVRA